jgi:hypothetical protein
MNMHAAAPTAGPYRDAWAALCSQRTKLIHERLPDYVEATNRYAKSYSRSCAVIVAGITAGAFVMVFAFTAASPPLYAFLSRNLPTMASFPLSTGLLTAVIATGFAFAIARIFAEERFRKLLRATIRETADPHLDIQRLRYTNVFEEATAASRRARALAFISFAGGGLGLCLLLGLWFKLWIRTGSVPGPIELDTELTHLAPNAFLTGVVTAIVAGLFAYWGKPTPWHIGAGLLGVFTLYQLVFSYAFLLTFAMSSLVVAIGVLWLRPVSSGHEFPRPQPQP